MLTSVFVLLTNPAGDNGPSRTQVKAKFIFDCGLADITWPACPRTHFYLLHGTVTGTFLSGFCSSSLMCCVWAQARWPLGLQEAETGQVKPTRVCPSTRTLSVFLTALSFRRIYGRTIAFDCVSFSSVCLGIRHPSVLFRNVVLLRTPRHWCWSSGLDTSCERGIRKNTCSKEAGWQRDYQQA